jgi:hypothetical protein
MIRMYRISGTWQGQTTGCAIESLQDVKWRDGRLHITYIHIMYMSIEDAPRICRLRRRGIVGRSVSRAGGADTSGLQYLLTGEALDSRMQ